MQIKLLGIISVGLNITDQIPVIYILHKSDRPTSEKWEYHAAAHQLFIDYKKACDSVGRDVLYNILTQSCIPKTPVCLIRMCSK